MPDIRKGIGLFVAGLQFSTGSPFSSCNKMDHHDRNIVENGIKTSITLLTDPPNIK
jgi:hypothetical protein